MGFEKQVLNQVEPFLDTGSLAYFENGTLFLEDVSDSSGKDIFSVLGRLYQVEFNIYNAINGFVVDFK
jgi:hypothetical protein